MSDRQASPWRLAGPLVWLLVSWSVLVVAESAHAAESDAVPSGTATLQPAPEVRTRHAVFRASSYADLPGWRDDDLRAGWTALAQSCEVLDRRAPWRDLCAGLPPAGSPADAKRAYLEQHFVPLRVLNPDDSPGGMLTGYFEPLLEGRRARGGAFTTPVLGVPRDLVTIDWADVPAAQRRGVVHVRPVGQELQLVGGPGIGHYELDLSRFVLDTRDRQLRLKLQSSAGGGRAVAYDSRAELEARGPPEGVDAPVLAWVADPLGLYAMQIQGSGRIRFDDGRVLRLQYAQQNGHPFRPLRVGARPRAESRTRAVGEGALGAGVDEFMLEADDAPRSEAEVSAASRAVGSRAGPTGAAGGVSPSAVEATVDQLLGSKASRPAPAPAAASPSTAKATAPSMPPPASTPAPASATPASPQLVRALQSDPSYVFFRVATDQSPTPGPTGALGVPLTAGGSVAVDPRVTPLGYPVFVVTDEPVAGGRPIARLMAAQDTGGAIRGAVRADFFWGFGAQAGQLARATRHLSRLWVLLPRAEAAVLLRGGARTRSLAAVATECLVPDGQFCQEVQP